MKSVLSIDGGGMFGLIPLQVLVAAERETGSSDWASKFDLIVGNSAGAIIGTMLANGYSAKEVSALFENESHRIFSRSIWHKFRTLNGFFGPKYSWRKGQKVFKEYAPDAMGKSQTKLMTVSYDMFNREPYFFKSWRERNKRTPAYQAVMASAAAPTYFAPREFNNKNLTDGAMVANNPTACAYAEALKLWPEEEIKIISLGTGEIRKSYSNNWSRNWGLLDWAKRVADVILDGGIDAVDYQMRLLSVNNPKLSYMRINEVFGSDDLGSMDDTSRDNIVGLIAAGNALAKKETADFIQFCESE